MRDRTTRDTTLQHVSHGRYRLACRRCSDGTGDIAGNATLARQIQDRHQERHRPLRMSAERGAGFNGEAMPPTGPEVGA